MDNSIIIEFKALLDRDELTYEDVEDFCTLMYRIGDNPLPNLRKWFKNNNLQLPVHYVESNITAKHEDSIMLRACDKTPPLLIVEVIKDYGAVQEVNIYFITDKILNRKYFNKGGIKC